MNGLWGWSGPGGSPPAGTLRAMGGPLGVDRDLDASRSWSSEHGGLAVTAFDETVRVHRSDGFVVAILGRPWFRDRADIARVPDRTWVRRIVEGFRQVGPAVVDRIAGGFAVVVLREDGREGVLAVDRIGGRHRLAYWIRGDGVVFGTRSDCVRAHPDVDAELDPQSMFDYLYFNVVPAPASAWTGIRYLEAAERIEIRDGRPTVVRYWRPEYRPDRGASLDAMGERFLASLRSAVGRHARGADESLGAFLSGGIDSSTLAGLVGEATGRPARTFSIGFGAHGFDEMEYARIASNHFGTELHDYYVTPDDVVDALPRLARAYAEPFGNASAVAVYACARLAREAGVRTMLGGDGGDELFGGNERYATQKVFGAYQRVPAWLRSGLVEPIALNLPGVELIAPLRKVRRYVEQARVPMPDRMETYNHLERYGVEHVLERDFLDAVDPDRPRVRMREVYDAASADDMLDRMLALDLKYTIADNDLPKVTGMCEAAQVDVEYPFLDDDVVEFSFGVPPEWKLRRLTLRWFVKRALRDYLPEPILAKQKHGFGLPFGVWMRDDPRLRAFTHDHLADLRGRGLVRSAFVDDLLARHAGEHATYYGVMIWVLLVLELWFKETRRP